MSTPFVGEIRLFSFPRTPVGWLPCDGSAQPISLYQPLFALIGTTFGGDGQSTFGMPDLRGRLPVHQGTGLGLSPRVPGQIYGTESVTLTSANIPSHTHSLLASQAEATATSPGPALFLGNINPGDVWYFTAKATAETMNPASVGATGQSLPHDNCMPTLTGNFCIAYQGVFPSQN